jgi:ubiquitin-activating enzyme E1
MSSDAMDVDDKEEGKIDEALYSRQLYVLGAEAMQRMMRSSVLIIGVNGLGVEIAKNVVLAGVKSVTLHDDAPTQIADLGTQFFLRESDIGQPRAAVTVPRLAELNTYVPIEVHTGELAPSFVSQFGIVVVAGGVPMAQAILLNDACRAAGTRFIMAETLGVCAATPKTRARGAAATFTPSLC